jgi:hypothetical protein
VPHVEVGGRVTALGAFGEGLHMRAMLGPLVTLNLSQRDALEVASDVMVATGTRGRIDGLYFLQYRRMLNARTPASPNTMFVTLGTGGYFFHSRIGERRLQRVDGSVVVFPGSTHAKLSPTRMATFNIGLEHRLNERIAARFEAGGLGLFDQDGYVGFRLLAGIAVPIGGYDARD